jgi:alkaline phosphatase D
MRAGDPEDEGAELNSERRTIGVVGVIETRRGKDEVVYAGYFRLHREFDRTGTFCLGHDVSLGGHAVDMRPGDTPDKPYALKPDTPYRVRLGSLSIDDPMRDDASISDRELRDRLPEIGNIGPQLLELDAKDCEVTIRTFPDGARPPAASLGFLLGSCRYPGVMWKIKEADRIFGPMLAHASPSEYGDPVRFTLMVGDQIYADKLNRMLPVSLADTYAEFQERYLTAFGSRNMRKLLRTLPTYMTLDDHEIEDNWHQDRLKDSSKSRLFNLAIGAYMSYQWSHGPRTWGQHLYYTFECAGYPFFVLDVRTQRFKGGLGLDDNHLLGRPTIDPNHPSQLDRLLDWLSEQQAKRGNAPKFIVSAGVFVPNDMTERWHSSVPKSKLEDSDSWPAFPATRQKLLAHIVQNRIQNVVFLSGDIHCSNVAEMRFSGGPDIEALRAFSVTSSAFYWPFPFADGDPNNYVHDSTAPGQEDSFPVSAGVNMDYTAAAFTQEDNFCRLDLDKTSHTLRVRAFDDKGAAIYADERKQQPLDTILQLANWT